MSLCPLATLGAPDGRLPTSMMLIRPMDLLDPASIDAFAQSVLDDGLPVDILINSAGIMAATLTRDARGY
jgi:short-subunit dehydrogenase